MAFSGNFMCYQSFKQELLIGAQHDFTNSSGRHVQAGDVYQQRLFRCVYHGVHNQQRDQRYRLLSRRRDTDQCDPYHSVWNHGT